MRLSRRLAIWLTISVVVWIFLTLALFYWVQKPFGPDNAAALIRTVLDLGAMGLVVAAGLATGSWLLRILRLPGLSRGDRVVFGVGDTWIGSLRFGGARGYIPLVLAGSTGSADRAIVA